MEGVAWETITFAGIHKLKNLTLIWDNNGISIDGVAQTGGDVPGRFLASGWSVIEFDGNDMRECDRALRLARRMKRPTLLAAKTTIGIGTPVAGTAAAHGFVKIKTPQTFEISDDARTLWNRVNDIAAGRAVSELSERVGVELPRAVEIRGIQTIATREIFNEIINTVSDPNVIGGAADLAGNTGTKTPNGINYGVREFGMGAIMNGLALAGRRPFGGTFLIFSDYMRPAIHLSGLMGVPVLYVFSHDSIALGADGPSHWPVEQLPSLRLIPNLTVARPCDYMETWFYTWAALNSADSPTAMILSRQKFKCNMDWDAARYFGISAGGYVYAPATGARAITIATSGAEVSVAMAVRNRLESVGLPTAVVSVPCVERFVADADYANEILETETPGNIVVWTEAAGGTAAIAPFISAQMVLQREWDKIKRTPYSELMSPDDIANDLIDMYNSVYGQHD
jgi:transketolase